MTPKRLLEWAEHVRLAVEGESLIEAMTRAQIEIQKQPHPPLSPGIRYDCNCPLYGTCMNTSCPRRLRVSCSTLRPIQSPRSLYDHA